jgi:cell division protein FtsB
VGGFARRWWPLLALLALLAALQAKLWFGAGGLPDSRALRDTVTAQRAENARLQQRNDALSAEVEDLKSGEAAVEERARSELGMVKPGETFYRVVEPHPPSSSALPAPAQVPAELPPVQGAPPPAADEAPDGEGEP